MGDNRSVVTRPAIGPTSEHTHSRNVHKHCQDLEGMLTEAMEGFDLGGITVV